MHRGLLLYYFICTVLEVLSPAPLIALWGGPRGPRFEPWIRGLETTRPPHGGSSPYL